jgi:putative membrane protein
MYVEERPTWLLLIFKIRGSILPRIWRRVAVSTILASIATVGHQTLDLLHVNLTVVPFTLIGLPLGIFLGFRNSAAYDRYWEGRKLWGQLVNTSRSFTRQVLTLIQPKDDDDKEEVTKLQRELVHRHVAFVHALRLALREEKAPELLGSFLRPEELDELEKEPNKPNAILQGTAFKLLAARKRGWIDTFHVPILEHSLVVFSDVQGACERIKNTPIPFSYTVLIHSIVAIYCVLLPFGVADTIKWMTPLVVAFIAYAFFGLDAIGDEIEHPFGRDLNDLPLYQLSRMIEANVRVRVGDEDLPAPVKPHNHVLL